jgi:hypothetical protein
MKRTTAVLAAAALFAGGTDRSHPMEPEPGELEAAAALSTAPTPLPPALIPVEDALSRVLHDLPDGYAKDELRSALHALVAALEACCGYTAIMMVSLCTSMPTNSLRDIGLVSWLLRPRSHVALASPSRAGLLTHAKHRGPALPYFLQTFRLGTGAATALLLALSAQPAAAQANELPALIHACYVPNTGTIYRIKTEDTKENCTSNRHIEFSWSQEGTLDHSELINLDQDDHLQYLLAEGVRESVGGVAVTGTFPGSGSPPVSGAGARLMWFPERAAFRVGDVQGAEWDLASIGSSSVAMGRSTTASGERSTAMGWNTTASSFNSTAMGVSTTASGLSSTAMGSSTTASGERATAMGHNTSASGQHSTAMGNATTASGGESTAMGFSTTASGLVSTAMGNNTIASGLSSTALGRRASTNNRTGSFVYGDFSTDETINANANNQFVVRAQRIWLGSNNAVTATGGRFLETSTGAYLSSGGTWTNASSRAAKENFRVVDPEEVLRKVAELDVPSWNYKAEEPSVRHVGPMAQDFFRAFGLGGTDEAISTVDLGGINMVAIQALERRTAELAMELNAVREENGALRAHNQELERRLGRLESLLRP